MTFGIKVMTNVCICLNIDVDVMLIYYIDYVSS